MLLSFSVTNFRSFREEQTLSMVASHRHPDHAEHLNRILHDENQALPVAVLYGANGAGKSNFVKALQFVENLVLRGTEPKMPIVRQTFALDKVSKKEPTEFLLQFVEGDHVYAYGFKVSDKFILAEWLSLLGDGKETPIFERLTDAAEKVTIEPGPALQDDSWGDNSKVLALTKVGVLANQLFLHATGNSLRETDQGPILAGALKWFRERLNIIPAQAAFSDLALLVARDEGFATFAGDFLRQVATGVDRLRVDTAHIPESMLPVAVQKVIEELPAGGVTSLARPDGTALLVEKAEDTKVRIRTIQSEHLTADGDRVVLPFSEESDGTQRLTHLLPALHAIRQRAGLFVIDEIDRSLHPLLAKGFVRAFLQACAGKGNQLIFTTHETAFLDLDLLRRDEIWFADKKKESGSTELYSLAEYKVRTDLKIDKAYLQGRFEAVPPIEAELPDWVCEIMDELKPKGSPQQRPLNEPA